MYTLSPDLFWAWVDSGVENAHWGAYHIQRARECCSYTLHLTTVSHRLFFCVDHHLRRKSTCSQKSFKRVQEQAQLSRSYKIKSLFRLPDPLLDSTILGFSQVTVEYKALEAIGACTIVCDTDLQRGRAMTSLFRNVTIELYAHFQSLLPLYYLWCTERKLPDICDTTVFFNSTAICHPCWCLPSWCRLHILLSWHMVPEPVTSRNFEWKEIDLAIGDSVGLCTCKSSSLFKVLDDYILAFLFHIRHSLSKTNG